MQRNAMPVPAVPSGVRIKEKYYPVIVRPMRSARRLRLRVDPMRDSLLLTVPSRCNERRIAAFLEEKRSWAEETLATLPQRQPLTFGSIVPIFGKEMVILPSSLNPDDANVFPVLATASKCEETVKRMLQAQLKKYIERKAATLAAQIDRQVESVVIRDTSSCWGSCTRAGRLMFSWRLVFAPKFVLDYVIAHEVAHLREMNHGPRFWKLNNQLCTKMTEARQWLLNHGQELYRYGSVPDDYS